MASTIIGKYPITQSVNSYFNEYGIQFVDYNFTIKSTDASQYIPKQGDAFAGVGVENPITIATTNKSKYLVTQVNAKNLSGGLMEIQVNTAGTQNIESPPIVSTLPNYPLIFGLKTKSSQSTPQFGYGSPNRGLGIMISFIDSIDNEADIFTNFTEMPTVFRGVTLPIPAKSPFANSGSTENIPGQNAGSTGYHILYSGYVRKEMQFQRVGGVTLFKIIFAESGSYYVTSCPSFAPGQSSANCSTVQVYNL